MNHGDAAQRPAALGRLDMAADLGLRHAGIVLEREASDRLAILVAAADAGEGNHRADIGAPMRERARLGGGVERLLLQADGRGHITRSSPLRSWPSHPPVMGGKKAISRAPAIAASARTCARSIAARITRGFSNACA